jgi:hypothetical protein
LEVVRSDEREPGVGHRFDLAIGALRAQIDEEFRISERLDGKARQAFALAAAFFAVTQTVAFRGSLSPEERIAILIVAVPAAILLLVTATAVANLEDLRREKDIEPRAIQEWASEHDDMQFARTMIVHLREVADRRVESNTHRSALYAKVATRTRWSLILAAVELLLAMVMRA